MTLKELWDVKEIGAEGLMVAGKRSGFMFELEGLDGAFLSQEQMQLLHSEWRSILRLSPGDELQIVFRKRVEFARWIEEQLQQTFLSANPYGRRILLDRMADQIEQMGQDEPRLLSQKIVATYWITEPLTHEELLDRRALLKAQLKSFGFEARNLAREDIAREIFISSQGLEAGENQEMEWPALHLNAGQTEIGDQCFRALEMSKLPENQTEFGMIQALTSLPYPLDVAVRLVCRDQRPIVTKLERKRNLLNAQRTNRRAPAPNLESQIEQIDQLLRDLANRSEEIYDLSLVAGLRFPKTLANVHRRALANLMRKATRMDFCELEECTLGTFDAYLECIPGFTGSNVHRHTVLGSNAIHFLPLFRPSKGDRRAVCTFETRQSTLYGIDPVDPRLANYNWLVSGTSGAGKSFFVNSLLAQSLSLDPNIFIVDVGGSYNKLTEFLGGEVSSLEPGRGFEMSPFFLARSDDPKEERLRRQHVFQIFLEMLRVDGNLPPLETRHLLQDKLNEVFEMDRLPKHPISHIMERLQEEASPEARRLRVLLRPWTKDSFNGQFLDNAKTRESAGRILTYDLKGLSEFEDLSRVVQLIVCASLWGKIRQSAGRRFSFIILDEVAFSLLKTQPEFVDELVSTLRKYFAGAVIVVQDLEKITSNPAGSSILQNTQSKAILQQRGDPRNYCDALSLSSIDQFAIESLDRQKGVFTDIFLIRDRDRMVIRHRPSDLEYWISTTAPEDNLEMRKSTGSKAAPYQKQVIDFVAHRKGAQV
jgi:hypothetical protein